jgi:hypothetical protein
MVMAAVMPINSWFICRALCNRPGQGLPLAFDRLDRIWETEERLLRSGREHQVVIL